jgi:hypothetical protein
MLMRTIIALIFATASHLQGQVSEAAAADIAHKINVLTSEFTDTLVLPTDGQEAVIVASTKILPTSTIAKRWHLVAACAVGKYFNDNPDAYVREIWFTDRSAMAESPPRYRVLPVFIAKTVQRQFEADEIENVGDGEAKIWNNLKDSAAKDKRPRHYLERE